MGFFTTSPAAPSAAPTFGTPAPTFGTPAPTFGTPAPTQHALPRHAATYQPKPVVIVAVIVAVVVALVLAAGLGPRAPPQPPLFPPAGGHFPRPRATPGGAPKKKGGATR